jgi:hypothetical protein
MTDVACLAASAAKLPALAKMRSTFAFAVEIGALVKRYLNLKADIERVEIMARNLE